MCTGSSTAVTRSEEHTSELQSHDNLVCRLLLEKKKPTPPCRHPATVDRTLRLRTTAHHVRVCGGVVRTLHLYALLFTPLLFFFFFFFKEPPPPPNSPPSPPPPFFFP